MPGPSKTRVLALWSAWDIVKYDAPAFGDPLTSQERPEERQSTSPGAPQDALRSPQGHLLGRLGMLWERSSPPKRRPEGPGELPKDAQERESGAQVNRQSGKSRFRQKCSATRPCRCARHFGPFQSMPKSAKIFPNRRICTCKSDFGCAKARQLALASQFARAWRVCTCI